MKVKRSNKQGAKHIASGCVIQYLDTFTNTIIVKIAWLILNKRDICVDNKRLLAITELGGYPDFTPLYEQSGYTVESVNGMRKAVRSLKQNGPEVIVAEFNFQSDFRDRTSSIETLMAVVQQMADIKVIIFYEKEYEHQFEKLRARFSFHAELSYPIDPTLLKIALQ